MSDNFARCCPAPVSEESERETSDMDSGRDSPVSRVAAGFGVSHPAPKYVTTPSGLRVEVSKGAEQEVSQFQAKFPGISGMLNGPIPSDLSRYKVDYNYSV